MNPISQSQKATGHSEQKYLVQGLQQAKVRHYQESVLEMDTNHQLKKKQAQIEELLQYKKRSEQMAV